MPGAGLAGPARRRSRRPTARPMGRAGTPEPLRGRLVKRRSEPTRSRHAHCDLVRYASDASPYRLIPQAVVMAHDRERRRQVARLRAPPRSHARSCSAPGARASTASRRPTSILSTSATTGGGVASRMRGAWLGYSRARSASPTGCSPATGASLGPDPASTEIACVGGVVANNSGGMRCGVAPRFLPTVRSMTFVLANGDGDRHRRPRAPSERFAAGRPGAGRGAGRRSATRSGPTPS